MPLIMSDITIKPQGISPGPQAATFAGHNAPNAEVQGATQAAGDGFDAGANPNQVPLPWAVATLDAPVLPDVDVDGKLPRAPLPVAAQAVHDGLAYCQRRLPLAMQLLAKLAAARMETVGLAKTRYGQSEATAALQAAELELQSARAGRRAMYSRAAAGLIEQSGALAGAQFGPKGHFAAGLLGQALGMLDKTFGPQRKVDDAAWQQRFLALRERMAKQLEELHGGDYTKAMQQLERAMDTSRQMATSNTDTLRSISHNL